MDPTAAVRINKAKRIRANLENMFGIEHSEYVSRERISTHIEIHGNGTKLTATALIKEFKRVRGFDDSNTFAQITIPIYTSENALFPCLLQDPDTPIPATIPEELATSVKLIKGWQTVITTLYTMSDWSHHITQENKQETDSVRSMVLESFHVIKYPRTVEIRSDTTGNVIQFTIKSDQDADHLPVEIDKLEERIRSIYNFRLPKLPWATQYEAQHRRITALLG